MGKVIGFLNQKGGVGKTSLTQLVANVIHHKFNSEKSNNRVLILDTDGPQYSIYNNREEEKSNLKEESYQSVTNKIYKTYVEGLDIFTIIKCDIADLLANDKEALNQLKDQFDYILIDTIGTINTRSYTVDFLSIFDFIFIPTTNNFVDVQSTMSFAYNIIKPLKDNQQITNFALVGNRIESADKDTFYANKASIEKLGFKVLENFILKKTMYTRLAIVDSKKGVLSTIIPVSDYKIVNLTEEILNFIN